MTDGKTYKLSPAEVAALVAEKARLEALGLRGRFIAEHADIVETLRAAGVEL